jgi:nucleotide-binding universal stress UspA family protein
LVEEVDLGQHTLIAIGSHEAGRRRQGAHGVSTAAELIHRSPCSVLVARAASDRFPRSIAVGIDGSPESAAAYAVARYLARRFDAGLAPIVATGGDVDERLVAIILGEHYEQCHGDSVAALAAWESDLLVVGSRGLHGLKPLGSVSERVADEASCSTLIVRGPAWQRVREELFR